MNKYTGKKISYLKKIDYNHLTHMCTVQALTHGPTPFHHAILRYYSTFKIP